MREITLSTGKKIVLREKKGQHHMIERKLLSMTLGDSGTNLGSMWSAVTIGNIVSIESVDGEVVKTPENIAEIYELMNIFTYEEWTEFESLASSQEIKDKLEELAKN